MRDLHADADLSAFLDGELAAADQARVETHLASCERCSRRLAELRATASLISALPYSRPARSLVPRVTQRWSWLRPLRSLSAVASGAFLFVFLLTAVAQNSGGLGGGATTALPAAAPAAPQATSAPTAAASLAFGAPGAQATSVPAPALAPSDTRKAAEAATAAPTSNANARNDAAASAAPADAGTTFGAIRSAQEPQRSPLQQPLLWLALAIVAGMLAVVVHMRLRAT